MAKEEGCCNAGTRQLLWLLAVIVLIALPIRLYLCASAAMISRDGAVYVWYAQGLAADPLHEMRRQPHHPGYPVMLLGAHEIVSALASLPVLRYTGLRDPVLSWQIAGMGVTLLGGLAVVLSVYALARALFNPRVAIVAGVLAALTAEFCQLSADVLTDMPHLAVYLGGAGAAVAGLKRRSVALCGLSGVLSGLAYLVRPEGAEVAIIAAAGALLLTSDWHWRRRLTAAMVVCIGAGAVASPYMIATGKLVQKKSIQRLLGMEAETTADALRQARPECPMPCATAGPGAAGFGKAITLILEKYTRSLRVVFLVPAVIWLVLRAARRSDVIACERPGGALVLGLFMLHALITLGLIMHFDYRELFSMRHVMVLAGLTLPFAAAALVSLEERFPPARRNLLTGALVAALAAPTIPWMLETRYADDLYLRRAGEWIRSQNPSGAKVLTTRHRVAFYANGVHVWSPLDADISAILAEARVERPDYLVFDERRMLEMSPGFFAGLENALVPPERLDEVQVVEGEPRKGRVERAIIYRYNPGS